MGLLYFKSFVGSYMLIRGLPKLSYCPPPLEAAPVFSTCRRRKTPVTKVSSVLAVPTPLLVEVIVSPLWLSQLPGVQMTLLSYVLKWGRHLQLPGRLSMAFSSAGPQCHGNLICDRTPQTSWDIVASRHTASYPEMSLLQSPPRTAGMQLLSSLAQSYRAQILALGKSEWPW